MNAIPLNATVHCCDGKCGKSSHVIIDPITQTITHLVVSSTVNSELTRRLVPIDQIQNTSHSAIWLKSTTEAVDRMADFIETHYLKIDPSEYDSIRRSEYSYWSYDYGFEDMLFWPYVLPDHKSYMSVEEEHIPAGEIAVHRGARIEATDGQIGHLEEFLIDPVQHQITHLILRQGHLWGKKDIAIPLSAVQRMDEHDIYLKLDREAVKALPAIAVHRLFKRRP